MTWHSIIIHPCLAFLKKQIHIGEYKQTLEVLGNTFYWFRDLKTDSNSNFRRTYLNCLFCLFNMKFRCAVCSLPLTEKVGAYIVVMGTNQKCGHAFHERCLPVSDMCPICLAKNTTQNKWKYCYEWGMDELM
jgi:rubrerythrin